MNILIVDDDISTLRVLESFLNELGHNVITAYDGLLAISLLGKKPLDLVLCDVAMPGADGFQVLEFSRSNQPTSSLPFILYTAFGCPEQAEKALELGAAGYWIKPLKLKWLMQLLTSVPASR